MNLNASYGDIALDLWKRYKEISKLRSYSAILTLNGMARLSKVTGNGELRAEVIEILRPFLSGEVSGVVGAYGENVYRFGGNAAAFLLVRGYLPEAKDVLIHSAELLCNEHPRDPDGLFGMPGRPHGFIWIDTVFGVCPFLLWTGLAAGRQDFVEESVRQMLGHHRRLFDPAMKLYHQAWNAKGDKKLTPAHWSRGVGWGLLALSEILYDLPKDHRDYPELLRAYRDVLEGCRAVQDPEGLWHQAMEDCGSYIETSGSALILYAVGRGLKNGSIASEDYDSFKSLYLRGLRTMFRYISLDGSVFNTCTGCLAPGVAGTVADYAAHPWLLNEEHAAGPQIMMLSQAETLVRRNEIPTLCQLLKG